MLGLDRDSVKVVPYSKEWQKAYEDEKAEVKKCLGDLALRIEHVGSTSIEGLSAKPIIDMAVGVKDKETLYKALDIMEKYGYDVKNSIEDKDEVLAHRGPTTARTHHLHVMVNDGDRMISQILFRDYLRSHPEEVRRYEDLKLYLATKYATERVMYTSSKSDYITSIIKIAKQEKGIK